MSSQLPRKRAVTRRPRAYRMAPVRRGGRVASKCDLLIDNDPEGKVLLSNVGTDVQKTTVEEKFSEFGKVNKVVIHCNKEGARIGTAEVWMKTSKEANKAKLRLNATDLFCDGRIIRIEKHKLLTKMSSFWKSVYKYVQQINVKISTETTDP